MMFNDNNKNQMSSSIFNKSDNSRLVILDEAYAFITNKHQDDGLKEKLRKIEGVPNATYVVTDNRVFVFAKLVHDVKEQTKLTPSCPPLEKIALSLIPQAMVTVDEAVNKWGVIPYPYILEPEGSGFIIRHQPFNALIPDVFETTEAANKALAVLLVGGIHRGEGDFTYRGQPMVLKSRPDVTTLPFRPNINITGQYLVDLSKSWLSKFDFMEGFSPVSRDLFEKVKNLGSTWCDASFCATRHSRENAASLWRGHIANLPLLSLNDLDSIVPQDDADNCLQLRLLYPELSMLSDGSLYEWFDIYQRDCLYINTWSAYRDEALLFFLIGMLTNRTLEGETARSVGEMVAFALLRGDSVKDALTFGSVWKRYDDAMRSLAHQIANAMSFLAEDKQNNDLRGHPITTMNDIFRRNQRHAPV